MGQVPDPRDLEERIGWIKASISERVSELGRRVERVRSLSDVTDVVTRNPLASVGVAFAVGVVAAALGRPSHRQAALPAAGAAHPESLVGAGLRTIVVSVAATYAKRFAQQWIDKHFHERELHEPDVRAAAHTVSRTPRERH
jgi:hypothetical protein